MHPTLIAIKMKLIIFSILLISITIPFSTQQLETQIFSTAPPSKSTQVVVDSTKTKNQFFFGTDLAKGDQPNALWLENMYRLDSMSSESSSSSLILNLLQRDAMRTESLSALGINSTVYSGISQGSAEFFTRIGFGTPAKLMQVILDTGSDDIWIQCKPCTECYNQTDPLFDPTKSNSSFNVLCGSEICPTTTCSPNKPCPYEISYGDRSHSEGDYMTETLTFRGTEVNNILFGCGHDNTGLFAGAAGLLGLGWGNKSFMGQAGTNFSHVFSYCLVGLDNPGKSYIMFGPTALSGKAVYTRLIRNRLREGAETYYYVALEGLSIGGKPAAIPKGVLDMDESGRGGVIIDSGTAVTRLAQTAYVAVRDAFRNGTTNLKLINSNMTLFDTCYDFSGLASADLPTVVLHFEGGADMELPSDNYMLRLDPDEMTYCFAFAGTADRLSIIGNIQQAGFRVSYDLKRERLGLTPGSCGLVER